MRIGTYNIRGLGGRLKKTEIRNFIRSEMLEFICIQETKMEKVDGFFC